MARSHVLGAQPSIGEVVVVTSSYHAARARHLFGVAFGAHAHCPVPMRVQEHAGVLVGPALAARKEHEKQGLKTLRTAPFGAWADFVTAHGLEACNRSLRWSRALGSVTYDSAVPGGTVFAAPSAAQPPAKMKVQGEVAELSTHLNAVELR